MCYNRQIKDEWNLFVSKIDVDVIEQHVHFFNAFNEALCSSKKQPELTT